MRITWIGHACFLIEHSRVRIVTDPFGAEVPYAFPDIEADLVTVSHGHHDHNAAARVKGKPTSIQATGLTSIRGVSITGIPTFHDDQGGAQRGSNILYLFELDGLQIAHLGDLGTALSEEQLLALSGVEILFIPVGGIYTIDARQAADLLSRLPNLKVAIPMHYKTDCTDDWPIETVEPFAEMMDNVRRIGDSSISVSRDALPEVLEVWIFDHA